MYRLRTYLSHLLRARTAYRVHSPFVYTFYQEVLRSPQPAIAKEIETFRQTLSQDQTPISYEDLGAGSYRQPGTRVNSTVGQLAHRAARRARVGSFLYHVCRFYQPQQLLELGTHLGFSALYQISAVPEATCYTIEGIPQLADLARQHLANWGYTPHILQGSFDQVLKAAPLSSYRPDYVLIDGNHRYEATIRYAKSLIPRMPDGAILVFDDLYWSPGMTQAWQEICQWQDVTVSIDLYWIGICFLRRPQAKEHFVFRI